MIDERETATVHYGAESWHGGSGWYYVLDEYPEEGSVGAFESAEQAIAHAASCGIIARVQP